MKLKCSVALVLWMLIQPTSSRAEDTLYTGLGAMTCGKIAQGYRQNPTVFEAMIMSWSQGFMNGVNVSVKKDVGHRDLGAITVEAQKTSLRNYCDDHPLAEFWEAVINLYGKFPAKE
jgi:hypothetical protein